MNAHRVLACLQSLGESLSHRIHTVMHATTIDERASIYKDTPEDFVYEIDKMAEDILVVELERMADSLGGVILVAEGIDEGSMVFPRGLPRHQASVALLVDPIDGTRGLMYDKRSAFFLGGAAAVRPNGLRLTDIEVAVMVELPTSRSDLSDALSAIRGEGVQGTTRNLSTGALSERLPKPSRAHSIYGGFCQISRFFSPGREVLAAIEEELIARLFPDAPAGKAYVFEDQYISTGGQLYEMLMGRDRFVADIRHGLYALFARQGKPGGHVCHPYDVAAHLIGTEAGLLVTDPSGGRLDGPFDTQSPVDWVAYANADIRAEVESVFLSLLRKYDLY